MHRVYAGPDSLLSGWLASILEAAGISCQQRNQFLSGALGELPVNECWPELWVVNGDDLDHARHLIAEALGSHSPPPPDWQCTACGELIEGVFAQCWRCATAEPP